MQPSALGTHRVCVTLFATGCGSARTFQMPPCMQRQFRPDLPRIPARHVGAEFLILEARNNQIPSRVPPHDTQSCLFKLDNVAQCIEFVSNMDDQVGVSSSEFPFRVPRLPPLGQTELKVTAPIVETSMQLYYGTYYVLRNIFDRYIAGSGYFVRLTCLVGISLWLVRTNTGHSCGRAER